MMKFKVVILSVLLAFFISCEKTKSELEYFQAGYDFYNDEQYAKAIENFNQVLENYPDGENAANSTFMIGFIYANNLENYEQAKTYYTRFIEKFPDHELVASARYELETLGKDVNELDIFKKMEEEQTETEEAAK
jgi:TolA-binding protein